MSESTCLNTPDLQAILDDRDAGGQPDGLLRHLDTCVVCQRALETLAGDPAAWEEAAHGLGEVVWNEQALQHVVQQLKTDEILVTEDKDLSFLRPADKPGLIGLFGSYEVLGEIGRGGMGVVLQALDPVLNRVVALKVLSPRLATSATARRRFLREGRAVAAVGHEYIVTVHGVSEADGLPYLVMQHITGESLQDRLDRTGPIELEEVVQIGLQTAMGLAAAHAQGLIHRDIKPANLLLESLSPPTPLPQGERGERTRVKITDFGLARMTDDVQLTQNGVLAGTPEYMAPEQARGEMVDHRADLFSLGSVLYAMGTGVSPFRGSTTLALIRQVSEETPTPMRALSPDVPVWLETLVARLMEKEPAERFQSAAEVAALLEGYLAHLQKPATIPAPKLPFLPAGTVAERSARWLPRLAWVGALAVVAALGLGFSLWFLSGNAQIETADGDGRKPVPRAQPASRGWLKAALFLGLGLTSAWATLASIWFFRRRRFPARELSADGTQQSTTQGAVSIQCPECGRNLTIKAELAGKKGKCPQCGKTIVAPQPTRPSKTGFIILSAGLLAGPGLVAVFLCFWTFRPTSFLDIPLGNQSVPGVADSGFYYDENDGEGPFRWTNGTGKLVIPLAKTDRPQALLVQLDRPENCSLRITVNNREVLKEEPSPNRLMWWEKTIDLSGVQLGEEVIVEIVSNTRLDQGDNARREIGVQVRGITLLSRRGEEEMEEKMRPSSFLNVTLGNHIVPRIEESGFNPAERGIHGRFRWTKGKARLVIPLDKKERPQAILVQLGLPRTRSVRITVNDHELLDEKANEQGPVVEWLWEKTFDVSGIDLGDKVTLEIISNIQPLLVDPRGDKTDARELGVAVRGIKLLGANQ